MFIISKFFNFNTFNVFVFFHSQNIIIEQMQRHLNKKTNIEMTGWLQRDRVNSNSKLIICFFLH